MRSELTKKERAFVVDVLRPMDAARVNKGIDSWRDGADPTTDHERGLFAVCALVVRKRIK